AIARGMRRQCQVEAPSSETGRCAVQGEGGAEIIEEDADETRDVSRRPRSSIQNSLRKLHVQLRYCKNNVLVRHPRHARATEQAITAGHEFHGPECEGMKCPRVARHSAPAEAHLPLECVSMDCKDMPGWIAGEGIARLGIIDETSSLHQENGKIEHRNQLFEMMLEDLIREAQPQTETERRECVTELVLAKLKDSPDTITNSAIVNDPIAAQQARARTIARMKVLIQQDKLAARRALDARPRVVAKYLPGDMAAAWRMVKNKGIPGERAHHRWRPGICMGEVRGNHWAALPGAVVKASPEQMRPAVREERRAWRVVEAELRTKMVDLEHYSGQRFEDIAGGERLPEAAAEEATPSSPAAPEPAHPGDSERVSGEQDTAGHPDGPERASAEQEAADDGEAGHPPERRRLRGKQTVDKRTLDEAHMPEEGQMADRQEQEEVKCPKWGGPMTVDHQGGSQSAASGQQVGGIVYPPSLPSPPLIDSADAHLAEEVGEAIVAGAADVLLTQGGK
ncbi:unnamed protein product, partial [Prorocentrum cordatum]